MLEDILEALRARTDIFGWSVRDIRWSGAQVYMVPDAVEARRGVAGQRYVVEVVRHTPGADSIVTAGNGNVTLLPGDPIAPAIENAVTMAGLVHNQAYSLPTPNELPKVESADPALQANASATLDDLLLRLRSAVVSISDVQLTAAEFASEEQHVHLCTSSGIDATRAETVVTAEWVVLCREGDRETEAFVEMTRRRAADIPIEEEVARRAQYALDSLHTAPPLQWYGSVLLRDEVLAIFLQSGVLQTLSSGQAKYAKASHWEIGQAVFSEAVQGDPLTIFATRRLPYGNHANRFDDEGLPAEHVPLIVDNVLQTFIADQRYADYLGIAPTGAFGDIEVPAGVTPASALMDEPYVEVATFSWFRPDPISGDFTSEIRLGYLHAGGKRTAFKGGALVGNVMQALAHARWSVETGFYGNYQGPTTVRFEQLTVAGEGEQP